MYDDKKHLINQLMEHFAKQDESVLLTIIENLLKDYSTEELRNLVEGVVEE